MKKQINQNNNANQSLEIQAIPQQAHTLQITDPSSLKEATSLLSNLNKYLDSIIEYKEKKTKPLNQALKVIRDETRPYETEVKSAIDDIRAKMTDYQTNLIKTTNLDQQKITARIGEGKGHIKFETAVKKLEELPIPDKTTSTDEGSVTFVEKKILKVTNLPLVPDEYWLINESLLLEDLKKGLTIPGVELDTLFTPRNIR